MGYFESLSKSFCTPPSPKSRAPSFFACQYLRQSHKAATTHTTSADRIVLCFYAFKVAHYLGARFEARIAREGKEALKHLIR